MRHIDVIRAQGNKVIEAARPFTDAWVDADLARLDKEMREFKLLEEQACPICRGWGGCYEKWGTGWKALCRVGKRRDVTLEQQCDNTTPR